MAKDIIFQKSPKQKVDNVESVQYRSIWKNRRTGVKFRLIGFQYLKEYNDFLYYLENISDRNDKDLLKILKPALNSWFEKEK